MSGILRDAYNFNVKEDKLGIAVWYKIFFSLNIFDLQICKLVNHRWNIYLSHEDFWRTRYILVNNYPEAASRLLSDSESDHIWEELSMLRNEPDAMLEHLLNQFKATNNIKFLEHFKQIAAQQFEKYMLVEKAEKCGIKISPDMIAVGPYVATETSYFSETDNSSFSSSVCGTIHLFSKTKLTCVQIFIDIMGGHFDASNENIAKLKTAVYFENRESNDEYGDEIFQLAVLFPEGFDSEDDASKLIKRTKLMKRTIMNSKYCIKKETVLLTCPFEDVCRRITKILDIKVEPIVLVHFLIQGICDFNSHLRTNFKGGQTVQELETELKDLMKKPQKYYADLYQQAFLLQKKQVALLKCQNLDSPNREYIQSLVEKTTFRRWSEACGRVEGGFFGPHLKDQDHVYPSEAVYTGKISLDLPHGSFSCQFNGKHNDCGRNNSEYDSDRLDYWYMWQKGNKQRGVYQSSYKNDKNKLEVAEKKISETESGFLLDYIRICVDWKPEREYVRMKYKGIKKKKKKIQKNFGCLNFSQLNFANWICQHGYFDTSKRQEHEQNEENEEDEKNKKTQRKRVRIEEKLK